MPGRDVPGRLLGSCPGRVVGRLPDPGLVEGLVVGRVEGLVLGRVLGLGEGRVEGLGAGLDEGRCMEGLLLGEGRDMPPPPPRDIPPPPRPPPPPPPPRPPRAKVSPALNEIANKTATRMEVNFFMVWLSFSIGIGFLSEGTIVCVLWLLLQC